MITRREAVRLLGSASAGAWYAATQTGLNFALSPKAVATKLDSPPRLAAGAPKSTERLALIDAFLKRSEGLQNEFEAREHKIDWVMPYRLFHPETTRKAQLMLYLHGSGGLGDDNLKQLSLGNRFGTRVWLLPEIQKRYPLQRSGAANRSGMDPIRLFATACEGASRVRRRRTIGSGNRRWIASRVSYR